MAFLDFFRLKSASKPQPPARQRPAAGALSEDYSVDGVIRWFERFQYVDEALLKAGLSIDDLEKLLDDDEIASCWEKRSLAVEQRPWGLSDPESEVAIFVWEQLQPHYTALVGEFMRAVLYGMTCPQITYRQDGGKWVIAHYQPHRTTAYATDNTGAVYVRINGQEHRVDAHPDLRLKFFPVIHRRTAGKPAGTALLSSLYWVVLLRTHTWEFWARYLERFGAPLLLGKAAQGMTADGTSTVDAMAAMLASAVNAGVAVVSNDEDVTAISSAGNGESFRAAQQAINERIQRRILGQTLTSGTQGVGSQALGEVHNDVRNEIVAADVAMIRPALQAVINALVEINFPGTQPPTLTIETGATLAKDRADRDKVLFDSGVRFSRDYYIKNYEFEDEDIEEVGASQTQAVLSGHQKRPMEPVTQHAGAGFALAGTEGDAADEWQQELDRIADEAIRLAGSPVNYEELRGLIAKAKSPDDLAERLSNWYESVQPEQQYTDALAALLFAADILGYEQAEIGVLDDRN
ncbi:DUF935 family protein [Candidatus Thiothrix sp. Deng01]|uniref:DUF935 family protein n=1 Tax=Candidatus Thiothrix phosphatis TaxID=3112415 RepID=A0ABU6CVD9_9GAMM|nr:DUF935 family protein [Candidatus Thiothrix sp. Deng01]MEB4590013.1 DUF935 family protein [Candidatus Thiothrix sp. Deng01]